MGRAQPSAHRTVVGDWVAAGHDGAEPELAGRVRAEQATKIAFRNTVGLLGVVETSVVGLPDVQHRAGQWTPVDGSHSAAYHAPRGIPRSARYRLPVHAGVSHRRGGGRAR